MAKRPTRRDLDRERFAELKADPGVGAAVETNFLHGYRIWILHRGESLFYQEGDRALICDLDLFNCAIPVKSIVRWDDGTKVTEAEREVIKSRIANYFEKYQSGRKVVFV